MLLRIVFFYLLSSQLFAQTPVEFEGTIPKQLPWTKHSWIQLLKINFSPKAHDKIVNHLEKLEHTKPKITSTKNTTRVDLGMNNVPVLNQGTHGSCVTFALTAALDAIIGKGDYVSQLCLLTLGQYLNQNSYAYSGWEGILPKELAARIQDHGIVSKQTQMSEGCGGLNKYPLISFDPNNEMSLADYHAKAQHMDELGYFESSSLLDIFQFLLEENPRKNILAEVKSSLEKGDRLAMATILIADENLSLWGKFHEDNDTWVYLPELKEAFEQYENISAHELIIIGYDDEATVIDKDSNEHQGVLILRNSWGSDVGDHGNFYMSYDYFNAFAFDILRIRNLSI